MKNQGIYAIIVSDRTTGETFCAYRADDLDEAAGYEEFCRAEMPGAMVTIERMEWEED